MSFRGAGCRRGPIFFRFRWGHEEATVVAVWFKSYEGAALLDGGGGYGCGAPHSLGQTS